MRKNLFIIISVVILAGAFSACAPTATDDEIQKMCEHLSVLRAQTDIKTDLGKCVAEAKKEGISERQARCRISASNTSEYFVRCRTGEARAQ